MRGRLLMVDHRDSYTHILLDYLKQLGWHSTCLQSEELRHADTEAFDLIILSPGFGRPADKKDTLEFICSNAGRPVLGICLGHQLLALAHEGTVIRAKRPLHGIMTNMSWVKDHPLRGFSGKQKIMHYHSWVVGDLPPGARALSFCDKTKAIMGMMDSELNYISWQFHPESIGTDRGLELLKASIDTLLP